MVAGKTKRTPEERKQLHAALARRPGVTEKIAEATAEYKKAVAAGALRRTPASASGAGELDILRS